MKSTIALNCYIQNSQYEFIFVLIQMQALDALT